ncbi:MAG: Crp/Fnr family transcriptional regulator [Gammaproteobacteria bacterium]|nr:Crp/Fnr family transcriptional regulator [Gammaproteobacteria bacterium]
MGSNGRWFSHFSREDIRKLAEHGAVRLYPAHSIVIHEGDESDALYIILAGKVKVFVSDEKGKEIILNIQGPLEYFGELSLIDQAPRSASIMTLEPTRLAYLSRASFEDCLAENPQLALKLITSLVERIRALTVVARDLALFDVHERVVLALSRLARKRGDKLVIEQRLTHKDIADMVGASREMVSRIMKELTDAGRIETTRERIVIGDKLSARC